MFRMVNSIPFKSAFLSHFVPEEILTSSCNADKTQFHSQVSATIFLAIHNLEAKKALKYLSIDCIKKNNKQIGENKKERCLWNLHR